jgi:hypothetical protein
VLEVRTNDCYAELLVDGEFVMGTCDMGVVEHLPRLAHKLGVEFSLRHGEWNRQQEFVTSKKV